MQVVAAVALYFAVPIALVLVQPVRDVVLQPVREVWAGSGAPWRKLAFTVIAMTTAIIAWPAFVHGWLSREQQVRAQAERARLHR
jgi:hypothetical protein